MIESLTLVTFVRRICQSLKKTEFAEPRGVVRR